MTLSKAYSLLGLSSVFNWSGRVPWTFSGFSLHWRQLWNVLVECSHECPPTSPSSLQVMSPRTE